MPTQALLEKKTVLSEHIRNQTEPFLNAELVFELPIIENQR